MATVTKSVENELGAKIQQLRSAEEKLKDKQHQQQRVQEKIADLQNQIQELHRQDLEFKAQQVAIKQEICLLEDKISQTENQLRQLTEHLGETKKERDRTESTLNSLKNQQQQINWALEKLRQTQEEKQLLKAEITKQLQTQLAELPTTITEEFANLKNPDNSQEQLEQLQKEIRNLQKRLEALEPVNMLALEEYEQTKARFDELSSKIATLADERTELLTRIENFTTLRLRAFKESFDAVNENFQSIFASLSDGDGYLQLDDEDNPFNGGLNLIAHPKGKPVQRLSSMSGGEKSLTALSFIFALQRYRPSPFYAFDEVDMFLDGANVEKLARMIRKQSEQAQFIVVSLRRPMIEAAERTIGVTQARGAHTQVLGIKL